MHGEFRGTVEAAAEGHALLINGNHVHLIYARLSTLEVDYTQYDIHDAIVIDNTGVWRDRASLEQHLRPGASHDFNFSWQGHSEYRLWCESRIHRP